MILRCFLSYTLGFFTPSPEIQQDLLELTSLFPELAPGRAPEVLYRIEAEEGGYAVYKGGAILEKVPREEVFRVIEESLIDDLIIPYREEVLLHSAVLVKDGFALLLPGLSKSGKTSLSVALLKRGFHYYSDELAPVTYNLRVKPCPLPMKIRERVLLDLSPFEPELRLWPLPFYVEGQKVFYALPTGNKPPFEEGVPIRLVVFPIVRSGLSLEGVRIPPSIGGMNLLFYTVNRESLGEEGFEVAVELAREVPCYVLRAGAIAEATREIEALWARESPSPPKGRG